MARHIRRARGATRVPRDTAFPRVASVRCRALGFPRAKGMRAISKTHSCRVALAVGGAVLAFVAAGCGGDDFANEPRPPAAVGLTGVIRPSGVTISPERVGAGAVRITIANLTDRTHSITLEGEDVIERVRQVQPQDTATIQKTLRPGTYEIRAGSSRAVDIGDEIPPATLTVGPERPSSDSTLLLP